MLGSSLNNFGSSATTLVPITDKQVVKTIKQYFELMWKEKVSQ
jgi:hypothetical protein